MPVEMLCKNLCQQVFDDGVSKSVSILFFNNAVRFLNTTNIS